jgi:molybdopterin synthase catalytic subunit/molybdopterin synthase sulfur carrier subunit
MQKAFQNSPDVSLAIRVLFFSSARTATGTAESIIATEGSMNGDALWRKLTQTHPGLAELRGQIRLARNGEFVADGAIFQPGDEVAIIPPVSGG